MLHDAQPPARAGTLRRSCFWRAHGQPGDVARGGAGAQAGGGRLDDDARIVPISPFSIMKVAAAVPCAFARAPILAILSASCWPPAGIVSATTRRSPARCASPPTWRTPHPNYMDRHEANHRPVLNGGPVIKSNAQQRYATCSRTAALFQELCRRAEVPVQHYAHRTDPFPAAAR